MQAKAMQQLLKCFRNGAKMGASIDPKSRNKQKKGILKSMPKIDAEKMPAWTEN